MFRVLEGFGVEAAEVCDFDVADDSDMSAETKKKQNGLVEAGEGNRT